MEHSGFKRPSFDPSHEIMVKFTDDRVQVEDAVNTGGPKWGFFSLLDCLKSRTIFDGPENSRFLTFKTAGKYFI